MGGGEERTGEKEGKLILQLKNIFSRGKLSSREKYSFEIMECFFLGCNSALGLPVMRRWKVKIYVRSQFINVAIMYLLVPLAATWTRAHL